MWFFFPVVVYVQFTNLDLQLRQPANPFHQHRLKPLHCPKHPSYKASQNHPRPTSSCRENLVFFCFTANTLQQNLLCDGVSIRWAVYVCHTFSLLFIALYDSSLTCLYFFYTQAHRADLWLTAYKNETLYSTSSGSGGTIWIHLYGNYC